MADTIRKTYKDKLKPTLAQEAALESVWWHCRTLDNAGLEQRRTWWERGQGKSATYSTYYQQQAELPDLKAACPEYAAINAQVVQDVLLRLERAFQGFFRPPSCCWRGAGLSPLPGPRPLQQFHLSAGGRAWRRAAR